MKFLLLSIVLASVAYTQDSKVVYTVMYFGATSCGPCNRPSTVNAIKNMKKDFASNNKLENVKYVVVCMDTQIEDGLKFISKYGSWDEISIGSWYENELIIQNLSKSKIPGVPHIIIYKDKLVDFSLPKLEKREIVLDILGDKSIVEWAAGGYKL